MKKPIIILSAIVFSLALGFAVYWMLTPNDLPDKKVAEFGGTRIDPPDKNPRLQQSTESSVATAKPNPTPPQLPTGNATPPESLQQAERAKWLRLIEVLGLDSDQAKTLEAAIAENRPIADGDTHLDTAYTEAGERLEQAILSMLSPEQQAAFREMQQRTLANRVEVKAQEQFSESLANIDLTSAQREQALEVLRIRAEEEASAISSGTRLLLGGSFLPIGDERTTDESFELMGQLRLEPGEDPPTFEQIAAKHREELERRMKQFEGILTPGQLALYQASLSQARENLDIISPQR